MRIAVLTLPLHSNYGGILQAYALQTLLKRMGHDVVLIEQKKKNTPFYRFPFSLCKRFFLKYILRKENVYLFLEHKKELFLEPFNVFINKYLDCFLVTDLEQFPHGLFDALIVGSDQVWRPLYYGHKIESAYFDFAKSWNVKRIAYAPSFGTDVWEYTEEQSERCAKLLRSFDAVSVREESGVALCREFFEVQAEHVLDPTMLLDVEDYIQIIKDSSCPPSEGTLLCYILDETKEKIELVDNVATERNLVSFWVNSRVGDITGQCPPVECWLRGFYDAEFIVTDSFHACVFSILFNKPFIAIGNKMRGIARFKSLLEKYGLLDRLIYSVNELLMRKEIILSEIDYGIVNTILDKEKKKSLNFIRRALNSLINSDGK